MTRSLLLCLAICSALIGLGSAIQCYSCNDKAGTCTNKEQCSNGDACLTLQANDVMTHRKCIKFSDCSFTSLAGMFPQIPGFTFECCQSNLCNSAPSAAASSAIGLLASLLVLWWCVL